MATETLERPTTTEEASDIIIVTEWGETEAAADETKWCRACAQEDKATPAVAECYLCEDPLCKEHNIGYMGWCEVQYDACAGCAAKKTELKGVNLSGKSKEERRAYWEQRREESERRWEERNDETMAKAWTDYAVPNNEYLASFKNSSQTT